MEQMKVAQDQFQGISHLAQTSGKSHPFQIPQSYEKSLKISLQEVFSGSLWIIPLTP